MTTSIRLQILNGLIIPQQAKKSRLFRHFHHIGKPGANCVIILFSVGPQAGRAILDAAVGICKIAAAFVAKGVQGAEAEQAVKAFPVSPLMAGEIFTLPVLEKIEIRHKNTSLSLFSFLAGYAII